MKIAVIGGAGSGKSQAAAHLKEKFNAAFIEADKVAHELYEPGMSGYKVITDMFGKAVLDDEFKIDRKKLAAILYSDKNLLDKVNRVIHPLVYEEVYRRMDAMQKEDPERLIVYEAAIMPEDPDRFDSIWYVHTDPDIRRKRLKETRGYTDRRIDEIMGNQVNEEQYASGADIIIKNNADISGMEAEIDKVMQEMPG